MKLKKFFLRREIEKNLFMPLLCLDFSLKTHHGHPAPHPPDSEPGSNSDLQDQCCMWLSWSLATLSVRVSRVESLKSLQGMGLGAKILYCEKYNLSFQILLLN